MTTLPEPLALDLTAPDGDWDSIRVGALDTLAEVAGDIWTDHNVPDPGVTLLEVAAYGLADLHYRTSARSRLPWFGEHRRWLAPRDRHWTGAPLPDDTTRVGATIEWLHDHLDALTELIGRQASRRDAVGAVLRGEPALSLPPAGLSWEEAAALVRIVRAPQLDRFALDHAGDVADALVVDDDPNQGSGTDHLAWLLADAWSEELVGLLELGRRRRLETAIDNQREMLRTLIGNGADLAAIGALLQDADELSSLGVTRPTADLIASLDADERRAVVAIHECPPGAMPENFEQPDGTTTAWPPHPLQLLTSEPVTPPDYERLALAVRGVRRAWLAPKRLLGIAWDGQTDDTRAPGDDPPAEVPGESTILVEAEPDVDISTRPRQRRFLRRVLHSSIGGPGGEALDHTLPFEMESSVTMFNDDLDALAPRRVLCDRVGVALLGRCRVSVKGVIHVAAATNRAQLIDRLRTAIDHFFREGRLETRPPSTDQADCPAGIDGPWPPVAPMPNGWTPGDSIRVSELIQILDADADVIGLQGVAARPAPEPGETAAAWSTTLVELPIDCVPVLADENCFKVQIEVPEGCAR